MMSEAMAAAKVVMYKTPVCPYCAKAKAFLVARGVSESDILELDITSDSGLMQEMLEKSGGRRTVPQIFINGEHVGGYDDLLALDRDGGLVI